MQTLKIMESVTCKLLTDDTLSTPENTIEFNTDNYSAADWSNNNDENNSLKKV